MALLAFGLHALTGPGALAATAVGTAILAGTGLHGGAVLLTFFIGSTVVSRVSPDPSNRLGAKGSRRDPWQVLANGGVAGTGALLAGGPGIWIVTASLAVAAADTWATSIGAWSPSPPRHLLSGKVVPPGTSGGITLIGTLGALAGAAVVAAIGTVVSQQSWLLPFATIVGLAGMLADSALGAGLQGRFYCAQCREETERQVHRCGTRSVPRGGLIWLNNDGVNALATAFGGMAGWAGWWWLGSR
ncbi:MAG TPA: DUF92 domain-containing protein [Gemmatimonadales bacterium]